MKLKITSLSIVFFLSLTFTFAQDISFRVLASKGTSKIISANGQENPLSIGKNLYSTDKIVLVEGCYIGLAHKSGKTIELKKAGTYEVAGLAKEVTSQNADIGKKYVAFLAGEMTSDNENMAANRHQFMTVTGSVERGLGDIKIYTVPQKSETKTKILSAPVVIKWAEIKGAKTYVVEITNLFGEKVFTKETTETSVNVDFSTVPNKSSDYICKIKLKEDPKTDGEYNFKCITDEKSELAVNAKNLKAELGNSESALNNLVLAYFYEDNQLYLNAYEHYEKAMKAEPEVETYKEEYNKFLERIKFNEKKNN